MPRIRTARHESATRWRLAAVVVLVVVCACGDDDGSSSTTTGAPATPDGAEFDDRTGRDEVVVQARDNTFLSQYLTVSAGTDVTFDNRGRNPHNVIPVDDGAFPPVETDDFQPGDEATVTFDEPGEYPYYCTLHGTETAGMTGTIVVRG